MDDLPERETPRVWIAAGIFLAAITLAFVMLVYNSIHAHAQQMLCVPGDALIRQTIEVKKQRPIWEGTIEAPGQPPAQIVITQSEKGAWSQFIIQNGTACLLFVGGDANPPVKPLDPEI